MGKTPRERILLFPFGTTHTKKYGPLEFDRADALAVMHEYQTRGNLLPIDVEHATQTDGPPEWQASHGWSALEVDEQGLHGILDYNANGLAKVESREHPYDSPAVKTWRGNHIRAVPMLSLVKDPARNGSTPLLMTNAPAATKTEPTLQAKLLTELHGAGGSLVTVLNEANKDPELKPLVDQITAGITDPLVALNKLMQDKGIAARPSEPEKPKVDTTTGTANMSGQASPLEVLGAELMARTKARTPDEALGALDAALGNSEKLLSTSKKVSGLLLLNAVMSGKATPDEVKTLSNQSPEYVERLLSDRVASVNTPHTEARQGAGEPPADLTPVTQMLARYGLKA